MLFRLNMGYGSVTYSVWWFYVKNAGFHLKLPLWRLIIL